MSGARLTIRLDAARAALVQRLSVDLACTPSHVVRRALDAMQTATFGGTEPLSRGSSAACGVIEPPPWAPVRLPTATPSKLPVERVTVAQGHATGVNVPALDSSKEILELLPHYRACGLQLRKERRILFHRIVAATLVAQENAENKADAELCRQLLRLGQSYGLLN